MPASSTGEQRFHATIEGAEKGRVYALLPFDPVAVWGARPRYHVAGTVNGGVSVIITGTNFTGASTVSFGGTLASTFTVNSATQITATAPAQAAGTVDVRVTTPAGQSAIVAATMNALRNISKLPSFRAWRARRLSRAREIAFAR